LKIQALTEINDKSGKNMFILILFENSGAYRREKTAKVKHARYKQ